MLFAVFYSSAMRLSTGPRGARSSFCGKANKTGKMLDQAKLPKNEKDVYKKGKQTYNPKKTRK